MKTKHSCAGICIVITSALLGCARTPLELPRSAGPKPSVAPRPKATTVNADEFYDYSADINTVRCSDHEQRKDACLNDALGCAWTSNGCATCDSRKVHQHCVGRCVWEGTDANGACVNREQHEIHEACGFSRRSCYGNVVADVGLIESSKGKQFVPFTADTVDPTNTGSYSRPSSSFANVALYNAETIGGRGVADGLLLLVLPGCNNKPRDYVHFMLRAARLGYHVISVPYWNVCGNPWDTSDPTLRGASAQHGCLQQKPETGNDKSTNPRSFDDYPGNIDHQPPWTNPTLSSQNWLAPTAASDDFATGVPNVNDCTTRIQRYKVRPDPQDRAYLLGYGFKVPDDGGTNGRIDNIEHRVRAFLQFLKSGYPDQRWAQFLPAQLVRWDKITVAGHSQGASLIAQVVQSVGLFRGIMLESSVHPAAKEGQYLVPTYLSQVVERGLNRDLWGFCAGSSCGHGALPSDLGLSRFLYEALHLPPEIAPADTTDLHYDANLLQTNTHGSAPLDDPKATCPRGVPPAKPTFGQLRGSGAQKLVNPHGTHASVRGELGECRPFVNADAWDHLLAGQSSVGGRCPYRDAENKLNPKRDDWCRVGARCVERTVVCPIGQACVPFGVCQ